jgi:hypothetical protein
LVPLLLSTFIVITINHSVSLVVTLLKNEYKLSKTDYRGNKILLGICAANILLFWLGKVYYVWRNKQKEAAWQKLTKAEQVEYITTTTDTGMKRLDFRFTH